MNPRHNLNAIPAKRPFLTALRRLGLAVILIPALAAPSAALAADEIDETRPLAADGNVWVENEFGEIIIHGWNREEIRITGDLGDDVKELQIRESGSGIRIRVDYRDRRSIDGAELELFVPEGANVEAESVSGDIEVDGLSGDTLELRTVSGDVDAAASVQRLELTTVSGDVEFDGAASRVSVESVSGEIELIGVGGEIDATTVSGDVTVNGEMLSNGEFEAVSGDVDLTVGLEDGGRINVSSMSGDIDVYLPHGQEGEFIAQTFSGDIDSAFGDARDSSRGPGTRLEHREGDSGATITLNSFSGDVSIHRR